MTAGAGAGLLIVIVDLSRIWPRGGEATWSSAAPGLRRTSVLAAPLLLAVAVTQIVAVVERYLASQLPAGNLSLLQYAMKLNFLPAVILAGAMTTVLYPTLSRRAGGPGFSEALVPHSSTPDGPCRAAPPAAAAPSLCRRVALAWNGSAEASRVVGMALPYLAKAEAVTILSAPGTDKQRTSRGPGRGDLALHGIKADVVELRAASPSVRRPCAPGACPEGQCRSARHGRLWP